MFWLFHSKHPHRSARLNDLLAVPGSWLPRGKRQRSSKKSFRGPKPLSLLICGRSCSSSRLSKRGQNFVGMSFSLVALLWATQGVNCDEKTLLRFANSSSELTAGKSQPATSGNWTQMFSGKAKNYCTVIWQGCCCSGQRGKKERTCACISSLLWTQTWWLSSDVKHQLRLQNHHII